MADGGGKPIEGAPPEVTAAVPARLSGCVMSAFGFVGFLVSPLWAVVAAAGLPPAQQDRAHELYFWGLAAGAVAGLLLVWDSWHFTRNAHRKPLPPHVVEDVVPLGYAASLWIERTLSRTVWGPFLVGVFGMVSLALVVTGFLMRDKRGR